MNEIVQQIDPVADALDDLAALGLHWARNRERGRMSGGIRQAMLLVAREALAHADMADPSARIVVKDVLVKHFPATTAKE